MQLFTTILAALILTVGLAETSATAEPIQIRLEPVPLHSEDPTIVRVGALEFVAGFKLSSDHPAFGGLSGLTLGRDGQSFLIVSDQGHWIGGRLRLAPGGALIGLDDVEIGPLRRPNGQAVLIRDALHDAEAVEYLEDGSVIVSFERSHRIWRYPPHPRWQFHSSGRITAAKATPFIAFDALAKLPENGGIEAMAPLGEGVLLLVPEEANENSGKRTGWLWRRGRSYPLEYQSTGGFEPTDFAVLPGGDLLALERDFSLVGGARARLVRIKKADIRPMALLSGTEIARLQHPLSVDNFEGLAIARAPDASVFVYLLSDDNHFSLLQDTLLLQFRLRL